MQKLLYGGEIMRAKKFILQDIEGSNSIEKFRKTISNIEGINEVRVDTVSNTVTVDYDETRVSENDIASQIDSVKNSLR